MSQFDLNYQFIPASDGRHQQFLAQYDGSQLRPLFAYENFHLKGHSVLSWIAPCKVSLAHMVDYEDKIEQQKICSDEMLHFIFEIFPAHLFSGVVLQRLISSLALESLTRSILNSHDQKLWREGDDLYFETRHHPAQNSPSQKLKLSISICSVSAVSTQIHFAMNTLNTGTPVPTIGLKQLGLHDFQKLAEDIMYRAAQEFTSIVEATMKVKPL